MKPRIGFVGLGWIGAMRMKSVAESGRAEVTALCDVDDERCAAAAEAAPSAERFDDYAEVLARCGALGLDGIVIATPNALHASQVVAALERGIAVFCQKPLGIDADETRRMISAARRADRLLGVDYSYRHTDGARALRRMHAAGEFGRIFAAEAVFHNAYGPDKPWCHDPDRAGGGALMDLGVHQIDLPLWLLGHPAVDAVRGRPYRSGSPLADGGGIDDFATAQLQLDGGATAHVAVSWNAHAGADCVYRITVYGTDGGAELRNIDGSFYDFELVRFDGRSRAIVSRESRDWLGRGILEWVDRLAGSGRYDPAVERNAVVAEVIDALYGRRSAVLA